MSAQLEPREVAPFDDSRKALAFALNANQASIPAPYANRAMQELWTKPPKSRNKALQLLRDLEAQAAADIAQGRRLRAGAWPANDLDKLHLAGYILQKFSSLDRVHQAVLSVRMITPAIPCPCSRPCCSGWTPVPGWVQAVTELCEITRQQALVLANEGRIPGAPLKVGLSTQPDLRRQLVKEWGTRRWSSYVDLAQRFSLTVVTVTRHRAWLEEWLDTQENNAWLDLDAVFDRTGITGPFL